MLFGEDTLDAVLDLVVSLACSTVVRADWVSVTLAGGHLGSSEDMQTRHATSPHVRDLDAAQYELDHGPGVEATRTGKAVNVVVDSPDFPWPDFGARARAHGVGSILSTPLTVRKQCVGAMNVYSRRGEAFGETDRDIARQFADQASVVLANAVAFMSMELVNEQLKQAVATRDLIGQAKGILMAHQGCTEDEAFDHLRRASQRENRKLRDLARDVTASVQKREPPRP